MKHSIIVLVWFAISSLFLSNSALALTMADFIKICESAEKPCYEYPILQAYVGGSLDLIAALDEETEYLEKIYCKKPSEIFNVRRIIEFMESHNVEYAKKNSMLLVIRYLEENGGCQNNDNE